MPRSSIERERPQAGCPTHWSACWNGDHIYLWNRCRLSKLQVFAYVHFMQKPYGRKIWRKQQTDAGTEISELPAADCGCVPRECASVLNFTKDLFLPRILQIHRANWVGKGDKVGKKTSRPTLPNSRMYWDLFRVLTVGQKLETTLFQSSCTKYLLFKGDFIRMEWTAELKVWLCRTDTCLSNFEFQPCFTSLVHCSFCLIFCSFPLYFLSPILIIIHCV